MDNYKKQRRERARLSNLLVGFPRGNTQLSDVLVGKLHSTPNKNKNISQSQFLSNPGLIKRYGFWKDTDKDSYNNFADCYPFDSNRHGIFGKVASAVKSAVSVVTGGNKNQQGGILVTAQEAVSNPKIAAAVSSGKASVVGGSGLQSGNVNTGKINTTNPLTSAGVKSGNINSALRGSSSGNLPLQQNQQFVSLNSSQEKQTLLNSSGYNQYSNIQQKSPVITQKTIIVQKPNINPVKNILFDNVSLRLRSEIERYQGFGYNPSQATILARASVNRGGVTFTQEGAKRILDEFNNINPETGKPYGTLTRAETPKGLEGSYEKLQIKRMEIEQHGNGKIIDNAKSVGLGFASSLIGTGLFFKNAVTKPIETGKGILLLPYNIFTGKSNFKNVGSTLYKNPFYSLGFVSGELLGGYGLGKISSFAKSGKGLKELQRAKPEVSIGVKYQTEEGEKFLVKSIRKTDKLKSTTLQTYEVNENTGQIIKGKGITTIENIKKGKILGKPIRFTFFGESDISQASRFISKEKGIKAAREIEEPASYGKVDLLMENLQRYRTAFGGYSKSYGRFSDLFYGEIKKAGYIKVGTAAKGINVYEDTLRLRFKPEGAGRIVNIEKSEPKGIYFEYEKGKDNALNLMTGFDRKIKNLKTESNIPAKKLQLKPIEKVLIEDQKIIPSMITEQKVLSKFKPEVETTFNPIFSLKQKRIQQTIEKEKSNVGYVQQQKLIQKTEQKQTTRFNLGSLVSPKFSQRQYPATKQIPAQIPKQEQKSGYVFSTLAAPVQVKLPIPPIRPKPIPFSFPGEKTTAKNEQGYNAYVRRDATKTAKARWEKLNREPLTQESALSMSAREVDESISARGKIERIKNVIQKAQTKGQNFISFVASKVKPKDKVVDTRDSYYRDNAFKFRGFRVKQGQKQNINPQIIEKSRYRSDKIREVQGLKVGRMENKQNQIFNFSMNRPVLRRGKRQRFFRL